MEIKSLKSLYIEVKYNEVTLGSATGFVVEYNLKKYFITNRHVVTGRHNETGECMNSMGAIPNILRVVVPIIKDNSAAWNSFEINLYDKKDNKKWIEHPTYGEDIDVAAIELCDFEYDSLAYQIYSDGEVAVTDTVYIIGYPYGYSVLPGDKKVAIWTAGSVASEPELGINKKGIQLPAFLVDAKTRCGQSGSPVFYHNNNGVKRDGNRISVFGVPVSFNVGIYSGRINKDSDLGYVWKWSVIKEILDSNNKK